MEFDATMEKVEAAVAAAAERAEMDRIVKASELRAIGWAIDKAIARGQHEERGLTAKEYRRWLGSTEIMVWADPDDPNEICVSYRDEGAVDFQEERSALWQELGDLVDDVFGQELADHL